MTYNISYDICALLVFFFILYFLITKKSPKQKQNVIFLILIVFSIVTCISDILNSCLVNIQITKDSSSLLSLLSLKTQKFLLNFSIYAYMIPHNIIPAIFLVYLQEVTNTSYKNPKFVHYITIAPSLISVILIALVNPFTGSAFYYSNDLLYHRGPVMTILYVIAFCYLAVSFVMLFFLHSSLPNNKFISIMACMICETFGVVFQLFFPYILVEHFVLAFGFMCILFSIENEEEIYNPVTKVYNRLFLMNKTKSLIESKIRFKIVVLKIINLNYYSIILGMDFINNVLHDIAEWLSKTVGKEYVYDCDAGNFIIMFYQNDHEKISSLERDIYNKFSSDWTYSNIDLSLNVKLCTLEIPKMVSNVESIMSIVNSDIQKSDIRISMLTEKEILLIKRRNAVQRAIQKALYTNSFQVYYQPIYDCKANKIHSAEALIRLYDEDLGFISPEEFIPIAEKNGTIIEIGQFVFDNACRFYSKKALHSKGIEFIEINLSPVQCMHRNLPLEFGQSLQKYGVSASSINLEITENAAINSPEAFNQTIQDLRNMRFCFSLDDYGSGYSNASNIFNLDFDYIKVDKSILWNADERASAKIVLNNTVEMIRQMNLKVIMEGVQTAEQKNYISSRGIDYIQGFYFSSPLPEADFLKYIEDFNNGNLPQAKE